MGNLNESLLQLQNNFQAIEMMQMRSKLKTQAVPAKPAAAPVDPAVAKAEKQDRKKLNATMDSINDMAFGKREPAATKGTQSVIEGLGSAFK